MSYDKMDPVHQACRVYGHNWDSVTIDIMPSFFQDNLVCLRCSTKRSDLILRKTGIVKSRIYKYAEGYQIKGGGSMDRYDKGRLRQAMYRRVVKK